MVNNKFIPASLIRKVADLVELAEQHNTAANPMIKRWVSEKFARAYNDAQASCTHFKVEFGDIELTQLAVKECKRRRNEAKEHKKQQIDKQRAFKERQQDLALAGLAA